MPFKGISLNCELLRCFSFASCDVRVARLLVEFRRASHFINLKRFPRLRPNSKNVVFARAFALIALMVSVIGCGIRIGEKPPVKPEIRVGEFGCMQDIGKTIRKYAYSEQRFSNETDEFFGCMKKSLEAFQTYVRGDQNSYYTPEELRRFFERFILKNQKISDELLHQLMVMKVNLVGGGVTRLSRQEISRAQDLLEHMKTVALELWPYMKLFNPKVSQSLQAQGQPLPPVDEAIRSLKMSGDRLGELMAYAHRPYALDDLRRLLEEVRKFANIDEDFLASGSAEDWVNMLLAFKEFTVRPSGEGNPASIAPEEWRLLMYQLAGWYTLWIRFQYSIATQDRFMRGGVDSILAFYREARDLLERAIASQNQPVVEFDKIQKLFSAMSRLNLLPEQIPPETAFQVTKVLVERVFGNPEISPSKRRTNGLTAVTLYHMGSEVGVWANIQLFLNDYFFSRDQSRLHLLTAWLSSSSVRSLVEPESLARQVRNSFNGDESYLAAFLKFVRNERPLIAPWPDDIVRVFLVNQQELQAYKIGYSFKDLSWKNLLISAFRMLLRGYAEDIERGKIWGVSKAETQMFYMDFKPLGEGLHIFDPRNCKAGQRSFLEGKLFTYAGTGYDEDSFELTKRYLGLESGVELLSFLISGGLEGRSLYQDFLKICPPPQDAPLDPFKDKMISKSCLIQNIGTSLLSRLKNMPNWQDYFVQLGEADRTRFVSSILAAVKDSRTPEDWVEQPELSSMLVVQQYIEAVFTRFDQNLDGILDDDEVEKAYPIYRKLIQEAALRMGKDLKSESDLRYAFNYILYYGEKPQDTTRDMLIGLTAKVTGWGFKLSRMEIARAFRVIVQSILESDRKMGQDACQSASVEPAAL